MPVIILETFIKAPADRCFDLSRSIDLHEITTRHTGEKAIGGRMNGLIELDETVTWRARHLGIWQTLTSKITAMQPPYYFVDEMISGAFKSFRHEHHFKEFNDETVMRDEFYFTSPFGWLGRLANTFFLTRYMENLLNKRNQVIKQFAETEHWKQILE